MLYTRIRMLREHIGLSQSALAQALGIHRATYARYEKGERDIPLDAAIRIAQYHGVSLDYLVGLSERR